MSRLISHFLKQVPARTCFLLAVGIACAADVNAQPKRNRPPPSFVQFGEPDQKEGAKILADFRSRTLGDVYFEFDIRFMPRRGVDSVTPGKMWLGLADGRPASLTVLNAGDAALERRLLVHNGAASQVWSWKAGDGIALAPLPGSALFEPLATGDLTAFDLQMPYLYWSDFVYEGVAKLRGRVADVFLMYPPDAITAQRGDLAGVRVYVDTQFHAMVQSEWIGEGNKVLKTLQVVDFKKVDEQWVVKSIDLRDETTRNKTRFLIKAAATGLSWPEGTFDAGGLAAPPPRVSETRIRTLAP